MLLAVSQQNRNFVRFRGVAIRFGALPDMRAQKVAREGVHLARRSTVKGSVEPQRCGTGALANIIGDVQIAQLGPRFNYVVGDVGWDPAKVAPRLQN